MINVTGNTGTFVLAFNGQTTAALPANSTAAQVQTALQSLSTIGAGNVLVTGSAGSFAVDFIGAFNDQGQTLLPLVTMSSGGAQSTVVQGSSTTAVQVVNVTGTAGTFTLSFNGQTTAALNPLPYNATSTQIQAAINQVQSALQGLSTIGPNNVLVTSSNGNFYVEFVGAFTGQGQNLPLIIASGANGTTATAAPATNYNDDVQLLSVTGTAGNFTLSFNGQTTTSLAVGSSPASVQTALNNLTSGQAIISVTGTTGSFTLSVLGQTTSAITVMPTLPVTVQEVQAALQQIVGSSNVTVSGTVGSVAGNSVGQFIITFTGALATSTAGTLAVSGVGSNGISVSVGSNVLVTGSPGSYQIAFVGDYAGQGQTIPTLGAAGTGGASASIVQGSATNALNTISNITLTGGGNVGTVTKNLQITNGTGIVSPGNTPLLVAPTGTGALRNVSGTNAWSGEIVMTTTGTVSVGVDSGYLTINGLITQTAGSIDGLLKVGNGTLEISGTASNNYTGTTTVNSGTLVLNKPGSAVAADANLVIGGNTSGNASVTAPATVQYGSNAGSSEVLSTAGIFLSNNGTLDLQTNGKTQSITTLVETVGSTVSSAVETGLGAITATAVTTIVAPLTTTSSLPATLTGSLVLTGARTFSIFRGQTPVEMVIGAQISGGAGGITKTGLGTLELTGANGYGGATTLNANGGTLIVDNNGALGSSSSVTVNLNSTLAFEGGVQVVAPNTTVTINGNGVTSASAVQHAGAIDNLGGQNTFTGPITLNSSATIAASTGTLTLSGNVSDVSFPLTVATIPTGTSTVTSGNLVLNGDLSGSGALIKGTSALDTGTLSLNNSTNNYTGDTVVNGGTLAVNGLIPTGDLLTVNDGTLVGTGSANAIDILNPTSPNTDILSAGTNGTPGILNTGSLTLGPGTTVQPDIQGLTAGTGYDQIISSGTVSLGSGANSAHLIMNVGNVIGATTGTQFTLITAAGGITGTFSGYPNGAQYTSNGNLVGTINYTPNSVVFIVTGIQDLAPSISLPAAAQSVNENTSLTFSTASGNAISVSDLDAYNYVEEVTLSVGSGTLALGTTAGLATVTSNFSSNVILTGTLSSLNNALNGLVYTPAHDSLGTGGSDTLTVYADDLETQMETGLLNGAKTATATMSIAINQVNQPPVLSLTGSLASPGGANATLNSTLPFSATAAGQIAVSDIDGNGQIESITISVVGNSGNLLTSSPGVLSISGTSGSVSGNGTSSITLSGTVLNSTSTGSLDALLSELYYTPPSGVGTGTLNIVVNDEGHTGLGGAQTASASVPLTVTGANQAPVVTVPAAQLIEVNTSLVFSSTNGTGITDSDVDADGGVEQVSLSVSSGSLALGTTTGLTSVTGNNSASVVIQGTLTALDNALNGLTYTPNTDFKGTDVLTVAADDLGHTGPLGSLSNQITTTRTVSINVKLLNQRPSIRCRPRKPFSKTKRGHSPRPTATRFRLAIPMAAPAPSR